MPVTHSKVSLIPDGKDDSLIRPSDWNGQHVVSIKDADVAPDAAIKTSKLTILDDANVFTKTQTIVPASGNALELSGDLKTTGQNRQTTTWHAYGGFQDQTENLSIDADVWTHVTNGANDLWNGLEAVGLSIVADELIVENAGDYQGTMSLTFEGTTNRDYLFRIYNVTQGVQSGYHIGCTGLGLNNYTNVCIPIYLDAAAGDHFRVEVHQLQDSDAIFYNSIFNVMYIHDG